MFWFAFVFDKTTAENLLCNGYRVPWRGRLVALNTPNPV